MDSFEMVVKERTLLVQPSRRMAGFAYDPYQRSYFVVECKGGMLSDFNQISRIKESKYLLQGEMVAYGDGSQKCYLVYEGGTTWISTSADDLRARLREFMCALHYLFKTVSKCHRNLGGANAKDSLVVSRETGKLAALNSCAKKCGMTQHRNDDVYNLLMYVESEMGDLLLEEPELRRFVTNRPFLHKLMSIPVEVIYNHPVWVSDLSRRALVRQRLFYHLQSLTRKAGQDFLRFENSCGVLTTDNWKTDVLNSNDVELIRVFNCCNYYALIFNSNVNEWVQFARFGRNASVHYVGDLDKLEIALEKLRPNFKSDLYELMVRSKTTFDDWNLEKI